MRDDRDRRQRQHHRRHEERAERGELDLSRLDLLPEPFGRSPDHQPGDEDRDQDVEEHPVEAGADAAEDHLAEEQVDERDGAAGRRLRVEAAVDRAVRGVGRRRPSRSRCWPWPKRTSLSDMLPPDWPRPCVMLTPEFAEHLRAVLLGREGRRATPTAKIANIAAKTIHACRRASTIFPNMKTCAAGISRIESISRKFVSAVRVLERDGRVRVVEAAAVRPELLDRDLRARPGRARSSACAPWSVRRRRVPVERLRARPARSGSRRGRSTSGSRM